MGFLGKNVILPFETKLGYLGTLFGTLGYLIFLKNIFHKAYNMYVCMYVFRPTSLSTKVLLFKISTVSQLFNYSLEWYASIPYPFLNFFFEVT